MAETKRHRKLGRWGRETWARERPLEEIPADGLRRIEMPPDVVVGENEPRFDAEAAELAVRLQAVRKSCVGRAGYLGGDGSGPNSSS